MTEKNPFEFCKPMPDQVTTERLYEAQASLARLCEVDAGVVRSSVQLAGLLRGVSQAVTDIVISRGEIYTLDLTETPGYDSRVLPPQLTQNSLYRYYGSEAPEFQLAGRLFAAHPARCIGANLSLHEGTGTEQQLVCEVIFPTEDEVDSVLAGDQRSWADLIVLSQDYRTGRVAYPFHSDRYTDDAPVEYMRLSQELSRYLLVTAAMDDVRL